MNKMIKTFIFSCMAIVISSCGGNGGEGKTIDVSNAEMIGENAEYIALPTKSATIMETDGQTSMKVDISMKKLTSGKIELKEDWTVDLLNANGITIASLECKGGDASTLENLLNNGSIGDSKTIVFTYNGSAEINEKDVASVRFNIKPWKDESKSDEEKQ